MNTTPTPPKKDKVYFIQAKADNGSFHEEFITAKSQPYAIFTFCKKYENLTFTIVKCRLQNFVQARLTLD